VFKVTRIQNQEAAHGLRDYLKLGSSLMAHTLRVTRLSDCLKLEGCRDSIPGLMLNFRD